MKSTSRNIFIVLAVVTLVLDIAYVNIDDELVEVTETENQTSDEEIDVDEVVVDQTEDEIEIIEDPYGNIKEVNVSDYLDHLNEVRDVRTSWGSDINVYLYENDILVSGGEASGRLIHNDFKIVDYDVFMTESKLTYTVTSDNGSSLIYVYDYTKDLLTHFHESDKSIDDLVWTYNDQLLVLIENDLYTYNLLDETYEILEKSNDNVQFIQLQANYDGYIDVWVRVWEEDTFYDVNTYMKKDDLIIDDWYKDGIKYHKTELVDSFDEFINGYGYEVIVNNEDVSIYRLNYDVIGIEVNGQKKILDAYSQSTELSPDKKRLSLVTGEQDAWGAMYIYDIESGSMTKAVDSNAFGAPKEAIWIDDNRLLLIYGYPHGHFSIGGSVYEYNILNNEKRLVVSSEDNQELFNLIKKNDYIQISSRTHDESFNHANINSFLVDENYEKVEDDPSILSDQWLGFNDEDETWKYFNIYDVKHDRHLISSMDAYLPSESPASTFNILLALIALEEGVITLEDSFIEWDKKEYSDEHWNKDQTLETAFRNSVVWYFEALANAIGMEKLLSHLDQVNYTYYNPIDLNESTPINKFWINRNLHISGSEQVIFLSKLYTNKLHFNIEHVQFIRNLMVIESRENYVLSGISSVNDGWQNSEVGWFIGHIISDEYEFTFSTMIEGDYVNVEQLEVYARDMLRELDLID